MALTVQDEPGHEYWMRRALELAAVAESEGEVPVGAVVVSEGQSIGEGYNQTISLSDPTAHAEIMALRAAAAHNRNYRLPGAVLYVTIEPCAMCAGALIHARIRELVYGATEPRAGAVCSHMQVLDAGHFNHRVNWQGGVLAAECSQLMSNFFLQRRHSANKKGLN